MQTALRQAAYPVAMFLAAALLVLMSAPALAHGGEEHAPATGRAQDDRIAADASLHPFCPPGSGAACGCGDLPQCDGGAKPAVPARGAVSFLQDVRGQTGLRETPARTSPQSAAHRPRAPPQLS